MNKQMPKHFDILVEFIFPLEKKINTFYKNKYQVNRQRELPV